jgi:hypothetical protein
MRANPLGPLSIKHLRMVRPFRIPVRDTSLHTRSRIRWVASRCSRDLSLSATRRPERETTSCRQPQSSPARGGISVALGPTAIASSVRATESSGTAQFHSITSPQITAHYREAGGRVGAQIPCLWYGTWGKHSCSRCRGSLPSTILDGVK